MVVAPAPSGTGAVPPGVTGVWAYRLGLSFGRSVSIESRLYGKKDACGAFGAHTVRTRGAPLVIKSHAKKVLLTGAWVV